MRHLFIFLWLTCGINQAQGQISSDTLTGQVTYTTSQSVYVKFSSTKQVAVGDTLYLHTDQGLEPVLVVKFTSSTSCVGRPITDIDLIKGMQITARGRVLQEAPQVPAEVVQDQVVYEQEKPAQVPAKEEESKSRVKANLSNKTQGLKGRILAASYVNFSPHHESDIQRMRYTLTMNTGQLGHTGISAETYLTFRHTLNEWKEVQDHFMRAFKIYSLALQYESKGGTSLWAGRKINPLIANVGAIDGLQLQQKWKNVLVGVFVGSRPDHTDYDFNFNLKQYGTYLGYTLGKKNGIIQSTLAFAEQRNGPMTDRRYAYFQHVNSAIRRINIFTSLEFDLYTIQQDIPKSTFNVSGIYFSLRYRASDKLSLFGSYDARKNIIYYETYKNFIDKLLEEETRQGFRFSFNYRPWKRITIGSNAGYRFQKGNPSPSKNLNSYVMISQVPGLKASATLSAVIIQSSYVDGFIYGVRMSRDLIKGKIYGEVEYRQVVYRYTHVESQIRQAIVSGQLTWRLNRKISLSANYEGEIQRQQLSSRIYTHVTKRF